MKPSGPVSAADLKPALPTPVEEREVLTALEARPPWKKQWFEVDGETGAFLKPGLRFQGGVVDRVVYADWAELRFFVLVTNEPEAP